MLRVVVTLAIPSALWLLGSELGRRRVPVQPLPVPAVVGALALPTLLAWAGRSLPELLVAWIVCFVGWAGALVAHDPHVLAASCLVGLTWGFLLGIKDMERRDKARADDDGAAPPAPPPPPQRRRRPSAQDEAAQAGDLAFRIALRCPTCGAEMPVPVYHRMALCGFCASEHLLVGHGGITQAVVPDAVTSPQALTAAVVKHFRRIEYVRLFEQRVRPLIEAQQRAQEENQRPSFGLPDNSPVVVAMEQQVSRQADAWAAEAGQRLAVRGWVRFLAPYWHRFGTLYQAAFGRDENAAKQMELVITTLEGSAAASTTPLPPMGKLSYLKALHPLHGAPEAGVAALPVELDQSEIDRKVQEPGRRSSDLSITPITHASRFVPEVEALIYRPFHVADVELDGHTWRLLVDGAGADVAGEPEWVGELQAKEPARMEPRSELRLVPSRCPECGGALEFAPDTVVHLCPTCFRAVELVETRWSVLPYYREKPLEGHWMAPFWRFPVALRTSSGGLISDLAHLTDGIDGTFDQIGDATMGQDHFFVPAFRSRVGKVGVRLYRRLWPLVQGVHELRVERFDMAAPPPDLLDVTLPADEARVFGRVYLALAFGPKDLARAEIRRVRALFLETELEGVPELAYLRIPAAYIAPNLALFGRARPGVLEALEGTAAPRG